MNRDITQILTDIKADYGTDINNSCTASHGESVITLDSPLPVPDNAFNGRVVDVGFLQAIDPVPAEEPFNELISVFNGTIISHIGTTVTLSGNIDTSGLANPSGPMGLTLVINKDTTIETECDNGIAKMASANPIILTNFDFPTYQSCFEKYDEFCTVLIQFTDSYQDTNTIDTYMTDWNITLDIEPSSLTNSNVIQNYVLSLNEISSEFDDVQNENLAYFERLKKLLSKFKVVDARIEGDNWEGMYNTKLSQDKTDMDTYYNYFLSNGNNLYSEYKISLMFNIKII